MNPATILALISDLYGQLAQLNERAEAAERERDTYKQMLDTVREQKLAEVNNFNNPTQLTQSEEGNIHAQVNP